MRRAYTQALIKALFGTPLKVLLATGTTGGLITEVE
jgi:hypothetical protein